MADIKSDTQSQTVNRNRWAEQEETVIANEIIKHHDVLFGPMTGCGAIKIGEIRRRGWDAIANVLNSQFSSYRRTGPEVKKKYYNMKDKTRSKNDELRRPGTGGGPRVKDFTGPEQILLELFGDSASLAGVPNAIDTDAPESASMYAIQNVIDLGKFPTGAQKVCATQKEDVNVPCSSVSKRRPLKKSTVNTNKRARSTFNLLAEANLKEEKNNIHLQQVNLRLKNRLIMAQLKVARLQAQKLEADLRMLKVPNNN